MTRMAIVFSTGLGIGYVPFAPGTIASLVALPVGIYSALLWRYA